MGGGWCGECGGSGCLKVGGWIVVFVDWKSLVLFVFGGVGIVFFLCDFVVGVIMWVLGVGLGFV